APRLAVRDLALGPGAGWVVIKRHTRCRRGPAPITLLLTLHGERQQITLPQRINRLLIEYGDVRNHVQGRTPIHVHDKSNAVVRVERRAVRAYVAHENSGVADKAWTVTRIWRVRAILRGTNEHDGIVVDRIPIKVQYTAALEAPPVLSAGLHHGTLS